MAAFNYRIDESNPSVSAWAASNKVRNCYFCDGSATMQYKLTSFTLPATSDSLISGISALGADATANEVFLSLNSV
jgi:hypothetical protein